MHALPLLVLAVVGTALAESIAGLAFGTGAASRAVQKTPGGPWVVSPGTEAIQVKWARMWNSTHGFAYSTDSSGGSFGFRRTTDSGMTWQVVHTLQPYEAYADLDWDSWEIVTAAGYVRDTPCILRSTDGGFTWKNAIFLNIPQGLSVHVLAVAWYDTSKALAGGYAFDGKNATGALFSTSDAGNTWTFRTYAPSQQITHLHPINPTTLIMGGRDTHGTASIWWTADEGASFVLQEMDRVYQDSDAYQVNMKSANGKAVAGRAIAGQHDSILRRNTDGSWHEDWKSPLSTEQHVNMVYNSRNGSSAVAVGVHNSGMQPMIMEWSEGSGWRLALSVDAPASFSSVYLYY
eukprot:Sspe_Gene.75664::Locus_47271_Transcript_1_1_Confidence_1.000_Length_1647::g.75664::m.75664